MGTNMKGCSLRWWLVWKLFTEKTEYRVGASKCVVLLALQRRNNLSQVQFKGDLVDLDLVGLRHYSWLDSRGKTQAMMGLRECQRRSERGVFGGSYTSSSPLPRCSLGGLLEEGCDGLEVVCVASKAKVT